MRRMPLLAHDRCVSGVMDLMDLMGWELEAVSADVYSYAMVGYVGVYGVYGVCV